MGSAPDAVDPIAHFLDGGGGGLVDPTPLFDGHWYRTVHGLHSVADPLDHYLTVGAAQGLDPSAAFDSIWYTRQVGELPEGITPLEHYLSEGGHRGIDPHPLFSSAWYLQQRESDPDGLTPLEHYLAVGWRANLDPCALFSARGYLQRNPDVAAGGVNPFVHYLKFGISEGREGTYLWDESTYREWFGDDVLVQRFGALGHYRVVAGPNGRTITASPAIDRVVRQRLSLEQRATQWLHVSDDFTSPVHIDWASRQAVLSFPETSSPAVAVIVVGEGKRMVTTLEGLMESATTVPLEVVVVGNEGSPQDVSGVKVVSADASNLAAVCTAALAVTTAPSLVLIDAGTDSVPDWLQILVAGADAEVGMVASTIVGDDLSIYEAGRVLLDDGSDARFGAGCRVGEWMFGVDRETDSCSAFGSLVKRSLLAEWLAATTQINAKNAGVSLSTFVRDAGSSVVVRSRAILLQQVTNDRGNRSRDVAAIELLSERYRREDSHVLVIPRSIGGDPTSVTSMREIAMFRALVDAGQRVHVLPSDSKRAQPQTEEYEVLGIEVLDLADKRMELGSFIRALEGKIEFVLLTESQVAASWASYLLEHLDQVPLVIDAVQNDVTGGPTTALDARVMRLADIALVDESRDLSTFENRVGPEFVSVGTSPGEASQSTEVPVAAILEAVRVIRAR